MNATGRVNRPSAINMPPASSRIPASPGTRVNSAYGRWFGAAGKSKILPRPCSRNNSPTMMRRMLRRRGSQVSRRLAQSSIAMLRRKSPHGGRSRPPRRLYPGFQPAGGVFAGRPASGAALEPHLPLFVELDDRRASRRGEFAGKGLDRLIERVDLATLGVQTGEFGGLASQDF